MTTARKPTPKPEPGHKAPPAQGTLGSPAPTQANTATPAPGTAVIVRDQAPASDLAEYTEGAVLNRAVLQPTIVQLVQKDDGAGQFRRIDTGEIADALHVTPLMVQAGRLKWPAGKFSKDAKPECWSVDGIRGDLRPSPDGRQAAFAGKTCLGCPHYTPRVTGDRDQGLCHPVHAAIFYDEEAGEPFILRLTGMVNLDAKSIVGSPGDLNMRRRHLVLASKKVEGTSGTYYRLAVQKGELLAPEEANDMKTLFASAREWELALRRNETADTVADAGPERRASSAGRDPLAGVEAPPEEELPF